MAHAALQTALAAVRFLGPALLVLLTLSLSALRTEKGKLPSPIVEVTVPVVTPRRSIIVALLSLLTFSYLFDGTVVVLRAVLWKQWEGSDREWTGIEISDVLGLVAYGGLIIIGSWKDAAGAPAWTSRRTKFFAFTALVFEVAQVVLLSVTLSDVPTPPPHIPEDPLPPGLALSPYLHIAVSAFRLVVLIPLIPVFYLPITRYVAYSDRESSEATAVAANGSHSGVGETSGLLAPTPQHYGTFPGASATPSARSSPPPTEAGIHIKPQPIREKDEEPGWSETYIKIRKLVPYLWPSRNFRLQFLAFLCLIILFIGRGINILLPLTLRSLVDELDKGYGYPLLLLFGYAGLRFLQGSGGLNAVRDVLWAPVMQYSDREMSQMCFDHLLNLSLAFHTKRKTGEILRILDRGASINRVFEILLFNIVPTILDIVIAIGAFFYFFGWALCGVIAVVMISYIGVSIWLTKWRTQLRRAMNDRDVITRGIHTDVLLNYDTVKYFNGEPHEGERYRNAIAEYQKLEFKVITSLNLLNFVQNFIISTGLLVGSLLVARRIVNNTSTAADFVFFITYLAQLYGPLNMLGFIYRSINQSLVDTEKLLKLLAEPTDVNDKPGAPDLVVSDGVITFENVSFSYDGKTTALNDVNFTVPKGSSVALVGESGAGKSTLLRLLFRQYDLGEGNGRILIDGQDLRDITQASLRKAIGVVPQDTVLFNESISYNIGYGKFGASHEEIEAAATAASLHERIVSFPDGYQTRVGERGVRLSGGEKQRVSIARTFLKNSQVLVLDEATSALDTATEKEIQKALHKLMEGRTSISIAHRLSTIASSDLILVLKDGKIVESGSHKELLEQNGLFAAMWAKQITTEQGTLDADGYQVSHNVVATDATAVAGEGGAPATFADAVKAEGDVPSVAVPPPQQVPNLGGTVEATGAGQAEFAPVITEEPAPVPQPLSPPVAFPTSPPVAFPTSDDSSSRRQSIAPTPGSITFKELEPPRDPSDKKDDEDKEPKRRRISSQNFKRLARRISLGGRKSSSSSSVPQVQPPSADTVGLSRDASVDLGSSGANTPVNTSKPNPALASAAAAAAALSETESVQSGSDTGSKTRRLRRKKPTKSKTGF